MDWHSQKWASIGYLIGAVVAILKPGMDGFMLGWGIAIISAAVGG